MKKLSTQKCNAFDGFSTLRNKLYLLSVSDRNICFSLLPQKQACLFRATSAPKTHACVVTREHRDLSRSVQYSKFQVYSEKNVLQNTLKSLFLTNTIVLFYIWLQIVTMSWQSAGYCYCCWQHMPKLCCVKCAVSNSSTASLHVCK